MTCGPVSHASARSLPVGWYNVLADEGFRLFFVLAAVYAAFWPLLWVLALGLDLPLVCGQREIQCIACNLPEVGVIAHEAAQPCVLQLLLAPGVGDRVCLTSKLTSHARRRSMDIEQRAISVKHAGADTTK